MQSPDDEHLAARRKNTIRRGPLPIASERQANPAELWFHSTILSGRPTGASRHSTAVSAYSFFSETLRNLTGSP
jgi:hypothetical protein